MTTIEHTPIKKIVIHEIEYLDLEEIIELNAGNSIGWIDGILYSVTHFPQTSEIVIERRDGTVHWSLIQYALAEDYKPHIKTKNNLDVMVIDKSANISLTDAIKFVKHYHKKVFEDNSGNPQ